MDFITNLPLTIRGHTGMVVFVDRLTKMVRLAPLRSDFSASNVADLLINQIFKHHGLPMDLVTDKDPRFTSAFFRLLTEQWGVRQKMSTSYHPQTDGQTEVMNRTLEDHLRARHVRWPKFVGTGTERNAFPFKKDLSLSNFFRFFSFLERIFALFPIFLWISNPLFRRSFPVFSLSTFLNPFHVF